jgi:hypothetical protein
MWRSIGPNNISGRITDLVVSPADAHAVLAASETGGIWETTDAGRHWRPLMNQEACLATSALAVHFGASASERVIYAGTGVSMGRWLDRPDGGLNLYSGLGLFVQSAPGSTWVHRPSLGARYVNRLHVDPRSATRLHAATSSGMKLSIDGGETWTTLTTGEPSNPLGGEIADAMLDPNRPDVLYVVVQNGGLYRVDFSGDVTSPTHRVTRLDGTRTYLWPRIGIGRSGVHGSAFLVIKEVVNTLHVSINDGVDWTHSTIPLVEWGGPRPDNRGHTAIAVSPFDESRLLAGSVGCKRSIDAGRSWIDSPLGSDFWRFAFAPSSAGVVYAAYDQGISRSLDNGATWVPVNFGLTNGQFYRAGNWRSLGSVVGGGLQDLIAHLTTGSLNWTGERSGPDAGVLLIDPRDPRVRYTTDNNGNHVDPLVRTSAVLGIYKTRDGGRTAVDVPRNFDFVDPVDFERLTILATLWMDPANPDKLFSTAQSIYVNRDGGSTGWTKVSQRIRGEYFQTLAIAPSDSNYVYAGTGGQTTFDTRAGGTVLRSTSGGSLSASGSILPWADVTRNLPTRSPSVRSITGLAVDPGNPRRVLVSIGAPNTSGTANAVYLTENSDLLLVRPGTAANDWQLRSNGLPNRHVHTVAIHPRQPNTFFAGTEVGVYRSLDAGLSWTLFDAGMPRAVVTELLFDTHLRGTTWLYAATYGRGFYKINLDDTAPARAVELYMRDNLLDTGEEFPSPSGLPNPLQPGENAYFWESPDIVFDVAPYQSALPTAVMRSVDFDGLRHESPTRGVSNRVYFQLHNRGTSAAMGVTLKAFVADACGALPPFPPALLSGGTSDPNWRFVGQVNDIAVEPRFPTIVHIDTRADLFDGLFEHTCIVAFVTAASDPIPTVGGPLNAFIPNTRHACQKNLHVVNSDGTITGCPMMLRIHNSDEKSDEARFDLMIEPAQTGKGTLYLMTSPIPPVAGEAKQDGVQLIRAKTDEDLQRLGLAAAGAVRKDHWDKLDRTIVYRLDANRRTALRGIRLQRGQSIEVYVNYVNKYNLTRATRPFVFKLLQLEKDRIVGGSTYEARPPAPRKALRNE